MFTLFYKNNDDESQIKVSDFEKKEDAINALTNINPDDYNADKDLVFYAEVTDSENPNAYTYRELAVMDGEWCLYFD